MQRHGRSPVHVVIAVDHNLLSRTYGLLYACHRFVHILHQERIVQVRQRGIEELIRFLYRVYASLYQQVRQNGGEIERGGQLLRRTDIALRFDNPSFVYGHNLQFLYILTFKFSLKCSVSFSFTSSMSGA